MAAPFHGALFPGGAAGAFVGAFKSTHLGNSEFTCSKNGRPCKSADEGHEDDDGYDSNGYDSDDDEEVDGVSRVSVGGLDRDEYVDETGVERIVISGEIYNKESSHYADAAYSDEYEDDFLEEDAAAAGGAQVAEEQQSFDSRQTCTKNGFPCGAFPEGSQKELNIERTSSCTRNGIPCEEYVDGQDDDQTFTLNKSNDSYKNCTRNGMPCEEYERLAAAGKLPEAESQYQVSNGGNAPPGMMDETVEKGRGKVGFRPMNINNT
ncbi:hypothetical protein BDZ91DRAFT_801482 [Kalaharituber pfeilii]|nr:hypothetical protein BDZ91DRAFT_801482 [Kalaharituber pfeilii]